MDSGITLDRWNLKPISAATIQCWFPVLLNRKWLKGERWKWEISFIGQNPFSIIKGWLTDKQNSPKHPTEASKSLSVQCRKQFRSRHWGKVKKKKVVAISEHFQRTKGKRGPLCPPASRALSSGTWRPDDETLYCNLPTNKDTPKPSEKPDRGDLESHNYPFYATTGWVVRRVLGQAQVLELLARIFWDIIQTALL